MCKLLSLNGFIFPKQHALAGEAKERLPVYHETGSKKIYEAQLTASDWTSAGMSSGTDKSSNRSR
jgi:hypothetical protein